MIVRNRFHDSQTFPSSGITDALPERFQNTGGESSTRCPTVSCDVAGQTGSHEGMLAESLWLGCDPLYFLVGTIHSTFGSVSNDESVRFWVLLRLLWCRSGMVGVCLDAIGVHRHARIYEGKNSQESRRPRRGAELVRPGPPQRFARFSASLIRYDARRIETTAYGSSETS